MRTRIRVTDLSTAQWTFLQESLLTKYPVKPFEPRACVEFELAELEVRHVELPLLAFASLMTDLHLVGAEGEPPNLLQQVRDARRSDR